MEAIKLKVLILFGILLFSNQSFAQNYDTIPRRSRENMNTSRRAAAIAAEKFTFARPLNIEFTHSTPYNFSSKKGDNSLPESKVKGFSQAKITTNINIIKKKKWLLSTSLGYNYISVDADVIEPFSGDTRAMKNDFHYLHAGANIAYFSTLFNKRTIYTSSIMIDGSEKYFERVRGLFSGTIILKANAQTKMGIGLAVSIDPLAMIPVIPTFSYEHKFKNNLTIDILLPKSIYLRKHILANGRVSLGTEMDQTTFYLYNIDGTDQKYQYRQLDIRSGIVYEHVVANHFLITAKTGIKLTPSGRLFRKEDSYSNPVYEITPDATFYFNIGVSFNPSTFLSKKK